jgi:hypothetical protein
MKSIAKEKEKRKKQREHKKIQLPSSTSSIGSKSHFEWADQ